jgi:hypothetical protein
VRFLIICLCFFLVSGLAQEDNFNITEETYILPSNYKPFKFNHYVFAHFVYVPEDWLESSINIPFPGYFVKYSLPDGFAVEAGIKTIIISNEFSGGLRWGHRIGKFHFGTGLQYDYEFGWLNGFGFNNSILRASQITPRAAIGASFYNVAITFQTQFNYLLHYYIQNDQIQHNQTKDTYNGTQFLLCFEQRMFKKQVVSFGIAMNFNRFNILTWPVYNPVKIQKFYPQFNLGLVF